MFPALTSASEVHGDHLGVGETGIFRSCFIVGIQHGICWGSIQLFAEGVAETGEKKPLRLAILLQSSVIMPR